MRCAYGERFSVPNCEECLKLAHTCDINETLRRTYEIIGKMEEQTKTDRILGKTKISPNHQIALIKEVRPWISAQPGDHLQYRKLRNGIVIIEVSKDDVKGGEK
jgi:hypothetical protein